MLGISGGLRSDHIITLDGRPRARELGGNAVFAAVGARLWIDEVNIISRAGENYPSGWLELLRTNRLTDGGIRALRGNHDHRTFYAYVDANTRVDTNPAAHYLRCNTPMPCELIGYVHSTAGQDGPDQVDPLAPMPVDISGALAACHLAPMAIRSHLELPAAARAHGAQVISVDPGERYMIPLLSEHIGCILSQTDVFLPSAMEVKSFFGDDIRELHELARRMRWFAERGPRIVVVKLGSDGSMVFARDDAQVWHFPALQVPVVDVTGAGDAFCGGFVGHFSAHGNPLEAAIAGTVSASFAIEDYGAMHVLRASPDVRDTRAQWVRNHMARVMG